MATIQVFEDQAAQTEAAVALFITLAQQAIQGHGRFSVALSGGSTPRMLYERLADQEMQDLLNWSDIHLFFGDERNVPPDHPDSNYRLVQETLLSMVPIPEGNVHRVKSEIDARLAAFSYEEKLRSFFEGEWPRFDLVLLGMGTDGHTASLFPRTAALNEEQRWFVANEVPQLRAWRLTLSKNAINAARTILVLVNGQAKAAKLTAVLTGKKDPFNHPVQLISPADGELLWFLDQTAASQLPSKLYS